MPNITKSLLGDVPVKFTDNGDGTNSVSVSGNMSVTSLPLPAGAATEATLTALSAKVPALVSGRTPMVSSVPSASSVTILGLTTNATGTNYTAFASQACVALDIVNNTGTTVEYLRNGAGTAMQIATGTARMVIGITNANQISVRRTDVSNTQVTLQAEAFAL